MPPKQNLELTRSHREFVTPNVDWDLPSELRDPPFSYNWEAYPAFVRHLIWEASVPSPASNGAGPSTRSTTNALPQPSVPLDQVVAALAAAFEAGQKSTKYKFQEHSHRIGKAYEEIQFARDTKQEMEKLKKNCGESDNIQENLAHSLGLLYDRVATLEAKDAAAATERNEDRQERIANSAQLEQAIQGIQALNLAMGQMAEQMQANAGGQNQEEEEVEVDFFEIDDLEGNPIEPEEADEEPEVINP